MKNNKDKSRRMIVYAVVLAAMILVSAAVTYFAKSVSDRYQSNDRDHLTAVSDGKTYTADVQQQEDSLASLANSAWLASYGYYFLMQRESTTYNIKPSDVFEIEDVFGTNFDDNDNFDISNSDREAESALFNQFVEQHYNNFIETLRGKNMDYYVEDTDKEGHLSSISDISLSQVKKKADTAGFYLELKIDANGQMSVAATDRNFAGAINNISVWDTYDLNEVYSDQDIYVRNYPKNMKIYIFSESTGFYDYIHNQNSQNEYYSYRSEIARDGFLFPGLICGVLVIAAAWVLLSVKRLKLQEGFLVKIPFEVTGVLFIAALLWYEGMVDSSLYWINDDVTEYAVCSMFALFGAQVMLFMAAGGIYSLGSLGIKGYFKEKTLTVRFARWIKRKSIALFNQSVQMVFDAKNNKTLTKIVILNFVVVALLCCFWFFGAFVAVIYSIVLFIVAKKYLDRIKTQYGVIHKVARDMAEGHLNTDINGDAGAFEPIREDLAKVREGVKLAVEEEVKSQKMKTELITNVSHDLKTPLTAIITYTNLLKDEKLTDEERRQYVDILDKKADRLKRLIEDLFEVSKANSGNIKVNKSWLDLGDLVRQATIENEDKLKSASIDVRLSLPTGKTMLELDGQKVYRIMDNLLGNVAKYSLPGTRAYVSVEDTGSEVTVTVKNISAAELPEDISSLTDRFVRGDKSRNTEGSGLGLAIVKSFAEVMEGTLNISVDGDLFKAVVVFYRTGNDSMKVPAESFLKTPQAYSSVPDIEKVEKGEIAEDKEKDTVGEVKVIE